MIITLSNKNNWQDNVLMQSAYSKFRMIMDLDKLSHSEISKIFYLSFSY